MSCTVCDYRFCYICNGARDQCICDLAPIRNKFLRYIFYFFLVGLFYMLIPMILVFGLTVYGIILYIYLVKRSGEDSGFIFCPLVSLFSLNCGLCLSVIAIPIALLVAPFFVCIGLGILIHENHKKTKQSRILMKRKMDELN